MSNADAAETYRIRFMLIGGTAMAVGSTALAIWAALSTTPMVVTGSFVVAAVVFTIGIAAAARGRGSLGVLVMLYGGFATVAVLLGFGALTPEVHPYNYTAVQFIYVCSVFSPFLTSPKLNIIYGPVSVATLGVITFVEARHFADRPLIAYVTCVGYDAMLWAVASRFSRYLRASQTSLTARLKDIDVVVGRAQRIAKGDLSGDVAVDHDNEVSRVISEMLVGLRGIVQEVQESVRVLASTSTNISTMATEQQRGAVHQSSAVAETRETIQSLVASSHKITEAADGVLRNARSAQQTNERANEQLNALANHTRRINELLEFVKDISSKSEILALNAALEGTRAGEAGRGFSLVAAQMRRLAESTASAIKDVKELTSDITRSTSATVISMEEATKLARDTTVAAQQISLITQQQSSGAQQVLDAMSDIATVTREFADGTKDALTATAELKTLSERFANVAHRFVM